MQIGHAVDIGENTVVCAQVGIAGSTTIGKNCTFAGQVGLINHLNIGDNVFYSSPYLYMTGHGNIKFTDKESQILRDHLIRGAFLHADDNYGMDDSFRREMKKVFPELDLVELPPDHQVFHILFDFQNGLPKIHEHDKKRPQALGLFYNKKLVVLYTYESDLGDGWEDPEVHNDPPELQQAALEMGTNIILYALMR